MVTIKGIGKLRRVRASDIFSDGDCGPILETANYDGHPALRLYQDDDATPVSDLMQKKNHIFALAKKVISDRISIGGYPSLKVGNTG